VCLFRQSGLPPQGLYLCAELVDDLLEVLDRGQLILNWRRQLACYPIGGHSDRLIDVLESKLDSWEGWITGFYTKSRSDAKASKVSESWLTLQKKDHPYSV
jgi:hypothetical protein